MHGMTVAACVCLFVGGSVAAPTDEELFDRATATFRRACDSVRQVGEARKLFGRAADDFDELDRRGVRSPGLYHDLGNAALLADRLPDASLAYHRGLRLDPNHAGLRDHLAFARSRVNYPPGDRGRPAPERWPAGLPRPTVGALFLAAAVGYAGAWVCGGWWFVRRSPAALLVTLAGAAVALVAGVWCGAEVREVERDRAEPLVVIARDGTSFQQGNGPNYPRHPDVPTLPAGLEARLVHRRGGWLHVRLATGELGWVRADAALVDEP